MSKIGEPVTLLAAHEVLMRERPGKDAAAEKWLAYYRRGAALYREIADIDRGHHHEALYWAEWERRKASEVALRLAKTGGDAGPG